MGCTRLLRGRSWFYAGPAEVGVAAKVGEIGAELGEDFSGLVGKAVEVSGRLSRAVCPPNSGAGISVQGTAHLRVR